VTIGRWRNGGTGPEEVRKMVGYPPTCSRCGSILSGYELNKEIDAFVYFCVACRSAEEKSAQLKAKEEVARAEVHQEAA